MDGPEEHAEEQFHGWQELPAAVLAHLVELVPYKRAAVKLACSSWRDAINTSLTTVGLPASDLPLLPNLPAVRHLKVTHPSSTVLASPSTSNPWQHVKPATLSRLLSLQLSNCDAAAWQLAACLVERQQELSGLAELQQLDMISESDEAGAVLSAVLPVLLTLRGVSGSSSSDQASSSSSGRGSAPLAHLQALRLHARLQVCMPPTCLGVLPQLTALRELRLREGAWSAVLPSVCDCSGLTELRLIEDYNMLSLPEALSRLTNLQVLHVTDCPSLRVFKGETALGALTALTELSLTASVGVWADFSPAGYSAAALAAASGQPPPRPGLRAVLPSVMLLPAMPHEQQLQVLPQLASLSNLRRLSLANNRYMRTLPACLSALTQLEVLDARACSIAFLNEELWQCTGLRELLLSDNVVQMLPDNIGQLKQLKVLDVGSCPTLWQLPTTLLSLSQLTRLVVVSKRIGQYVIEQLEMRPTPVEVEFEGDSDFTDDDDEEGLDPDDPAIYEEHWTDDDYGDEADDPEMWYHAV